MLRLAIVCLLVALVVGCAASPHTPTPVPTATISPTAKPTPTVTPTPSPSPPPTPAAQYAYDFSFKLFQGEDLLGKQELRLAEVMGRPVVLNFWARFCTPCWSEMPELQDFHEEHGEDVLLLGIDVGQFTGLGSPKDAGKLLSSLGVTYPAGYTDDPEVVRNYQVRAMPTTVFITGEGEVFRTWTGSISREMVTAIAREMLEEE